MEQKRRLLLPRNSNAEDLANTVVRQSDFTEPARCSSEFRTLLRYPALTTFFRAASSLGAEGTDQ
jgi:hypothetical protein